MTYNNSFGECLQAVAYHRQFALVIDQKGESINITWDLNLFEIIGDIPCVGKASYDI